LIDDTDHLVSRGDVGVLWRKVPLGQMEVGSTHAACADMDAYLSGMR
jgi:hypothetical protein